MSIDLVNPPPGYEVIDYLGGGAMGDVYLARQISLGREVALKVSKRNLDKELHTTLDRLLTEALTIARLDHPNIVPVFDCISHDSRVFIVMKYVEGFTLGDLLKGGRPEFAKPPYAHFFKDGKLRREAIVEIGIRLAEALAYAHERGIYHRDIKPSNIFVDKKGRIVLIDFGIARDSTRQGMTATGVVVGTPHYMSPEQIRGVALDGRSDLYAVGCVLYHCITGRVPFNDTNEVMVCIKHLNDPLPSIDAISCDSDPDLNAVIVNLLEKEPDNRTPTADALAEQLGRLQPGSSASIRAASILHGMEGGGSNSTTKQQQMSSQTNAGSFGSRTFALPPGFVTRKRKALFRTLAIGTLAVVGVMSLLVFLAENPDLDLPVNLEPLKRENWLVPLLVDQPAVAGGATIGDIPRRQVTGDTDEPASGGSDLSTTPDAETSQGGIEVAVVLPTPRATPTIESPLATPISTPEATPTPSPTPEPTPTPTPTPLPLWMAVPPPDGLEVEQEGWQPYVDWLAPRGQRFEIIHPTLTHEMEVIGDHLYVNVENPHPEDVEIALIATVRVTETTVARTPFGITLEEPVTYTIHRGSPFRDEEGDGVRYDGTRIVLPAEDRFSVPLIRITHRERALLGVEAQVESLVVAGRGRRLGSSSSPSSADTPGLAEATMNLVAGAPMRSRLDTETFGSTDALRQVIDVQTRLVMPPAPLSPAMAEVLAPHEVQTNIQRFLLNVNKHAQQGSQLLPSLITDQRLNATVNGGAELELTLAAEPGDLKVSVVVLSGLQTVTISHNDGSRRDAIRPLAGMGTFDHPVRLAARGGRVRIPLIRWTMQGNQQAVLASRIDIKTLAVLLHDPHSSESESQPPRFRRIANLEASR